MTPKFRYIITLGLLIGLLGCAKANVYYPGNGAFNPVTPGTPPVDQVYWDKIRQLEQELIALSTKIDETEARGDLANLYNMARSNSSHGVVADILKTMSHRPDFLGAIMQASRLHFSNGALTEAQHEMIASYVSALNRCHY